MTLTPAQRAQAQAMSEAQLMDHIRALCQHHHLAAYHPHDSRRSWGPGYPDLTIIGPGGPLWAECKTQDGQLTQPQRYWARKILTAGLQWKLWRPTDLLNGSIETTLKELSGDI